VLFKKKEFVKEKMDVLNKLRDLDPVNEKVNEKKFKEEMRKIEQRAAKAVMQEYFDNDKLHLLPKPIMETQLLTQIKNNRELPLYGYKQSLNIVSGQVKHKTIGDGKKHKNIQDVLAFRTQMNQTYISNAMAIINGRIRFEQADLYV